MDPRIITRKLELIRSLVVAESRPICPWQARAARHLAPGEYEYLGDWRPVPDATRWPALETIFLQSTVCVPDEWDPSRTFLSFGFEAMEGLLSVGGRPWAGLDFGHNRVPAPGPGEHALAIEFLSVPAAFSQPGERGRQGGFSGGQVLLVDPEVEAAWYDLRFAAETANALPDGRRKTLLSAALEDALIAINLAAPRERVLEEIRAGRALLAGRVAEIGPDPEGGRLFLTGHTHIDTAWLWPLKETVRKCERTFSTACRLMERYPEYRFSCSQAQLFAYVKQNNPALYQEIRRWVGEGRWETTGGMWVEADANVTSGESLIRQILYGLAFFREEFGTRPTLCWLPDVFGYNAGMPQILAGCGLRSFWTWKLHWQSRDPFPHHLFWWEGVDGSRVLAHIPQLGGGGYNGTPNPAQLARSWETYVQKGGYPEQLFPFGYGDGGGGVTAEMMEFANRASGYPGLPACRQGTAEQFFADVYAAAPDLPTWVGELYLETHRGTYTTQGRAKRGNRQCEIALREAEVWGTLAALGVGERGNGRVGEWGSGGVGERGSGGGSVPSAGGPAAGDEEDTPLHPFTPSPLHLVTLSQKLRSAWETTLLHQFHDILPGSSIGEVYADTAADHARVLAEAWATRDAGLSALAGPSAERERFRVFNSLSWERHDVISLRIPDRGGAGAWAFVTIAVCAGREVPAQVVARRDGMAEVVAVVHGVPSVGALDVEVRSGSPARTPLQASGWTLESDLYLLELGEDGSLVRLLDRRVGREVIPEGQPANRLHLFQDGPEREAAWNIHATYAKREYPWEGESSVEIVESGPVRAVARVTRRHHDTVLTQEITLYAGLPRIDFRTHVEWHERQTLLKVAFPVAVRAAHATFEVQFGALERPTHRNTSWEHEKFEVCGLRWADLSEGGYGVSLLNDCKYGHDVLGNVLRLSLLRGTDYPDPDADQGAHDFTYSLLPHAGDWREGETVRRAAELNAPLAAVPAGAPAGPVSYLRIAGPAVLETLKPAEDGDGAIVRLYEPNGARGCVTVEHALPFREVVACSLVEENEAPVPAEPGRFAFDLRPFQIRTFRLH